VVPIVALSANLFDDQACDIQNLDIQGYIHKPFREDELFGTIGKVLGIQYVYEEEIPKATTEFVYDDVTVARDIGNLPAEILFRLQDAVEIADSDQIATIFESFGINNQRLAQHLTTMSNNFEWEYLQQLLKTGMSKKAFKY
jgi:CheY-like chemotaxis protein